MYYRTHNCNELRAADEGKRVKIAGWLDSKRDKGGLLFAVIRDFYGVTQVVADSEPSPPSPPCRWRERLRFAPRPTTNSPRD